MSERYRLVTARFRAVRPNSIFVENPRRGSRGDVSISRSLLHGGDDLKMDGYFAGEEITFRLMDWKAEELGFA